MGAVLLSALQLGESISVMRWAGTGVVVVALESVSA